MAEWLIGRRLSDGWEPGQTRTVEALDLVKPSEKDEVGPDWAAHVAHRDHGIPLDQMGVYVVSGPHSLESGYQAVGVEVLRLVPHEVARG